MFTCVPILYPLSSLDRFEIYDILACFVPKNIHRNGWYRWLYKRRKSGFVSLPFPPHLVLNQILKRFGIMKRLQLPHLSLKPQNQAGKWLDFYCLQFEKSCETPLHKGFQAQNPFRYDCIKKGFMIWYTITGSNRGHPD